MTTLSRKAQWTNADGLVIGFGNRYSERQRTASHEVDGVSKQLVLDFTWASTNPALDIPAGFMVVDVFLVIGDSWVDSGDADSGGMEIGDGNSDIGYYTESALSAVALEAADGSVILPDGAYFIGDAATNHGLPKLYASADTLDIDMNSTGAVFTEGSARLVVVGYQTTAAVNEQ